ncbi:MAG TPA: TonB-dependent receptor plug domain-containing protein, partial [Mucilaginibacter sp.]|nr:TonB-dependent receptor plug domain-containing protein [Mucilaginibacter sp.]
MKKIIFLLAVLLMSFQLTAFCQNGGGVLNSAIANLKTQLTDHMLEKAYLHFDRPYACYVAGEVVYFKAYVFMGERHEPSTISNVLHVELIDKNNVLLRSISLQLVNGTGWGDFALPDSLEKGTYRVRAYTQWMRNEKNPYYFDQFLSVSTVNGVDRIAGATGQGQKPDLQFFPEGGSLVAEVPSKIAFKAIGANGLGIGVNGVVVDNEHKEVAKITTAHLGMGEFNFIPELGKTYQAAVTFANGAQATMALPAVQQQGITLSVKTDDPSKVSITIRANRPYYKDNVNRKYELLIYSGGSLKHYSPVLDNSILGLDLPASGFQTGIVKITLMSEAGEPLNERLVFVQNADLLNLSVTGNKPVYTTRENVELNLNAKNKDGAPVNGSFSVSVVDESNILVDESEENSILSYLLLTTELKGRVERPNFYFSNVNSETRADLDILMLTQGFRRFDWKELENNGAASAAIAFAAEKEQDISGMLKTKSGDPVPNCTVTLIPQGANGGTPLVEVTDNAGKFKFSNVFVAAGAKFILKAQTSARKNLVLTLDKAAPGPAITPGNPFDDKYNAGADILGSLQNNRGFSNPPAGVTSTNALLTTESINTTAAKNAYRSSNIGGPGHADRVVLGDQVKNTSMLSISLQGLMPQVQYAGGEPYLNTGISIGGATGTGQGTDFMLVMVDGVNMGIGYNIDLINPQSVETIELLTGANATIYGSEGGEGVLVITTRVTYGGDQPISKEMSPGIFSIEPSGFYKAREFYVPKYGANAPADHRTTIFWKPDLVTDSGGNSSFNFMNSDGKGTYRVEIQGADSKGN